MKRPISLSIFSSLVALALLLGVSAIETTSTIADTSLVGVSLLGTVVSDTLVTPEAIASEESTIEPETAGAAADTTADGEEAVEESAQTPSIAVTPSAETSTSTATNSASTEVSAEAAVSPTNASNAVDIDLDGMLAQLGLDGEADGALSVQSVTFKQLLSYAWQFSGIPYVWGGKSLDDGGFDCSGFVGYVYDNVCGTNISGTSASFIYSNYCTPVSADKARPGDLVFFTGTYGGSDHISHVGIYCGNGIMFDAGDPIAFHYINRVKKEDGSASDIYYAHVNGTTFADTTSDVKFVTDVTSGVYQIASAVNTNKVLDVTGFSTVGGGNIQLYQNNKTENQMFYVTDLGNGYFTMTSTYSGLSLDVAGFGRTNCTNVQQYPFAGTSNQKWLFKDTGDGDGTFYIISQCNGLYLDVPAGDMSNGNNIQMYTGYQTSNQKFKFVPVSSVAQKLDDGIYTISGKASGDDKVLDIAGYSSENGANIQLFQDADTANQKFNVTYLGDGYYKIESIYTDRVLDVVGWGYTDCTNVQLFDDNGTTNQQWILQDAGDGYFYVISRASGLMLDVTGGSSDNCTNIQMFTGWQTDSHKFKFTADTDGSTVDEGTYYIESALGSNLTLDVVGFSKEDCTNVQVFTNHRTTNQQFELSYIDAGYYKITNVGSGKALDAAGFSGSPCTNVQQFSWWSTANQLWKIVDAGDGSYRIVNGTGAEECLDVVGGQIRDCTNVQLYPYYATANQKWNLVSSASSSQALTAASSTLEAQATQALSNGTYYISSGMDADLVLDVVGFSTDDCANVQIYGNNATTNQRWDVVYLGNGYYEITNVGSGKALDACGSSGADCTNVQQFTWWSTANQKWCIKDAGDGYYYLVNGTGINECLDAAGARSAAGTNVQLYGYTGASNQKWKFTEAEQPIANGTYTISSAMNGLVLDVAGYSKTDCANVQTFTDNKTSNQEWTVTYLGDGSYSIIGVGSGKALDACGFAGEDGTNVQQFTYNNTANQHWTIKSAGDGTYYLVNGTGINECADIAGFYTGVCGNVQLFTCNGTDNQKWEFNEVDEPNKGYYYISSAIDNDMVLDIAGLSYDECANLQLFTNHETANQKFAVADLGDGYYSLTCAASGLAVDAALPATENCTNVQQFTNYFTDNQQWLLRDAGDGYYYIVSKASGLCLDIPGGDARDCANVQLYQLNGTDNQKFKLTSTKLTTDEYITTAAHYTRINYLNDSKWVLPSVCIAQGFMESGYGNSGLSISAQNYFGVKASSSWTGRTYTTITQESATDGSLYTIVAAFKAYSGIGESVDDYYNIITSSSRYTAAVNNPDARSTITAIGNGGYFGETNVTSYADKIMAIINTYNLTQYDKR